MGKTSACRLFSAALCCPTFSATGEPCGECEGCRSQHPRFNGDAHGSPYRYRHWEVNSPAHSWKELRAYCSAARSAERSVLTLDELDGLTDPADQRPLLKFAEDFRGVLLAAVTLDHETQPLSKRLIPPLAERFRQLRLRLPTEGELFAHFGELARSRGIAAGEGEVRLMVRAAGRKFRNCFQVFDRAGRDGRLTREVIADALSLPPDWDTTGE